MAVLYEADCTDPFVKPWSDRHRFRQSVSSVIASARWAC